jgi:hypothetical protein
LNVPVKALDLEEEEELVLLAETVLLTEELLLLDGLAEVRWWRGMASVWTVYDRQQQERRNREEARSDAKVVSIMCVRGYFVVLTLFAAVQLCPTTSGVIWSGRRVEERGRFWLEALYWKGYSGNGSGSARGHRGKKVTSS